MDQNNNSPATGPQNGRPVMDVQAPKPEPAAAPQAAPAAVAQGAAPQSLKAPKKGNTPFGVILVAILVALTLGGLTVYSYMKTGGTAPVQNTQQQSQQKAGAGDVDDTTKGIDESLKSMDDSADFNDSDLSDTNLGL